MFLVKLVLALAIIIAALVLVFRFHKQLKGESSGGLRLGKNSERAGATDLEEFIAAYRADKAVAGNAQSSADQSAATPIAPAATVPVATANEARGALFATPKARTAFLSGPAKLGFLVLKTGLPDHHVFAHTRLADLLEEPGSPGLANTHVDLLVCNKELAIVAAVDLPDGAGTETPVEREKQQRLAAAGIRYLRFTPGRFPKPAEVRALIYPT